jgi:hypothetical protein
MLTFRWLTLRLFWSLLLLLLLAFPALWLLHEVVYPGLALADELIVLLLWISLFAIASLIFRRAGAKRFALLEEAVHEAITNNENEQAERALTLMQSLFAGGLLSSRFQQKVKRRLLRQHFSFHAAHPEKESHRERLLEALREGIRAEESYDILKTHVLQQPALTLPTVDLAEELLDRQPDDGDLLDFLARQYLKERQTHFRAEPIFAKYLARNGPMVPEIVALGLGRLLKLRRQDDFAVWCCVRAFQRGEEKNSALRQSLYLAQQRFQQLGRHDALAKAVTSIATEFASKEIAGWAMERQEKHASSLRFRAARARFYLQQKLLNLYSRLREQRKWVYTIVGSAIVLGVGYIALFGSGSSKTKSQVIPTAAEDTTKIYYALQVSALRSAKLAEDEAGKLRRRGLEVHVIAPGPSQRLHRIRVGKYRSKPAAQIAADSLKAAGIVRDYFVTEYEKP